MDQQFAFNVWDAESGKAVIEAAARQGRSVMLQTSARVFAAMDCAEFAAHVRAFARRRGVAMTLHLDHCKDRALLRAAVDAGWDAVMVDASSLPLAENIAMTNEVAAYAHAHGVRVEAEVGQIGKTGQAGDDASIPVASMDDIRAFLAQAHIDFFAAAIGTAHGLYHGTPVLHHDMIDAIGRLTPLPFVIHGGTGLSDAALLALLTHPNVKKINISTDVKQAYRRGILASIDEGLLHVTTGQGFEATRVTQRIFEEISNAAEAKLALLDAPKEMAK
ncbi:class II fructose-bisphosphate aldolase [Selenomonas sp.]|uniref:class II fructose-bisphosphate aldolase n=1 Tax=Selenomonas sp. TaxID=2053611 RepID=UPI0025FB0A01|nr:class II fructose-bisphosphate aldolase [Selenomonas sp.]MCI6085238.1 class II fructose-bisphosphate aldolase [Selenomonas sp.]MDY3298710.1 class II fructose-bisphosphate aldolase [Selenomonas sp.]MDY4415379.1 class II fructose-bisphosphate aldolase [Selenomonas sp.]